MNDGWYTYEELKELGFREIGDDVKVSRKTSIYGAENMKIGSHVRIDDFCMLVGCIEIGNHVHIGPYCNIHGSGGGEVVMRDFATLSSRCTVYAGSDDYNGEYLTSATIPEKYLHTITSQIVLEKYSICGLNCVLLPGAYMAEGCALGAMSMLSKATQPWGIYVGIPCRRIKERSSKMCELARQLEDEETYVLYPGGK